MFLIALSSIALAVLLALGPFFMAFLFFDPTRRFFSAWIAQLANYALITILTVMTAALLLQIVQSYAAQTAARGTAILTVDALNMILIAVLVFLVLRQVMPIASGLAGGVSLNSFGLASRGAFMTMRSAGRLAAPAMGFSLPYVARTLGAVAQGTGHAAQHAATQSRQYLAAKAGAGIEALGRNWRNWRR
jgi:type IV secretion system protein VirB6